MEYYLMNKDNRILSFETTRTLGDVIVTEKERFSNRLPIGFTDISLWLENRNYAKHKDSLKKYLKDWGIENIEGFIDITHCLGLNDTLWVKSVDSSLHWDEVSLYTNDFSDVMEKTAFGNGLNGIEISSTDLTSPEFVSPGSFAKCWRREKDGIYLYKTTGSLSQGLEPFSEYFASQIASKFSVPTVDYELTKFNGKLCTKCKMFTSEKVGLIPFAGVFDISKKKYNIPTIISACDEMGVGNEIRQMYMIDSLILNQDRHLGNIGFLFDNDTFEIIGLSPIYDFNISMLCDAYPDDMQSVHTIDDYIFNNDIGHKCSESSFFDVATSIDFDLPVDVDFCQNEKYMMDGDRFDVLEEYIHLNYDRIKHKNFYLNRIEKVIKSESIADCISELKYNINQDGMLIEVTQQDFRDVNYLNQFAMMYGISSDEKILIRIRRDETISCVLVDKMDEYEIGDDLVGDKQGLVELYRKLVK